MESDPNLEPKDLDDLRAYFVTEHLVKNCIQMEVADRNGGIRKLIIPRQAIIDAGIDFDNDEEGIDAEVLEKLLKEASDPSLN